KIAGAEHAGRVGLLQSRQPRLQLGVERMIAGDQAGGAGAHPVSADRRDGGLLDGLMLRQVEVVVAGERQQPAAAAHHPDAVGAPGRDQRAAQVRALQLGELLPRKSVERAHCRRGKGGLALERAAHRRDLIVLAGQNGPALRREKHRMSVTASGLRASDPADPAASEEPGWYESGLAHVWLPYAQMKTASPLPVARTHGSRIVLADGRELIDGIASWWTACHGYNHPRIRQAVARQLDLMPHVMFGGLVHEQALVLARRL